MFLFDCSFGIDFRRNRNRTNSKNEIFHERVQEQQVPEQHNQDSTEEDFDIELGLGDFFGYSLLIGKVSVQGNWIVVLSCFFIILVGMSVTFVLFIKHKAVPALPIPLSLGLITYYLTDFFIVPLIDDLT